MTIGVISYLAGFLAYSFLTVLLVISWHGHRKGLWLIIASAMMTLWAGVIVAHDAYGLLSAQQLWTIEVLRAYVWLAFFAELLNASDEETSQRKPYLWRAIQAFSLMQIGYIWISTFWEQAYPQVVEPGYQLFGYVLLSIIGVVTIEQLFRNTRTDMRWRIKFLCLALGALFIYDFYFFADALLFHRIRDDLWTARGAVAAMLTPFIAISAARNRDWSVEIFVSRHVVFHSAALFGAGTYLLLMVAASNHIKLYGGEWGVLLQIVFLVGAFMVLALILFSGHIRAQVRIFLSKHFFHNTYDYREEWLRLIATLSGGEDKSSLEERVIQALCQIVESPSGVLWGREPTGRFVWRASFADPGIDILAIDASEPLIQYLEARESIINLKEMVAMPEAYNGLNRPHWLARHENAWLLIPLTHRGQNLDAVALLTWPTNPFAWNWEVIDMLKTASRLAASYLALEYAAKELAEAQQFAGFNRLSAFVIHDLKNLVAQLSLVVRNADRHQDNPEFMKDAIKTVDHAVGKMNTLMTQLRNSSPAVAMTEFDLVELVREVVESRKKQLPAPQYALTRDPMMIWANRERLSSALEHIIQNGQDAAGKDGQVLVCLSPGAQQTAQIEVKDNGRGMDHHFIRTRLFKPFETTKGLTGMGIGAYESREYIRSLGGDLMVESEPGKGSVFRFVIPLAESKSGDSFTASRE